ncbi:MAG: hypothetical protein DMG09_07675, partial [Acidobacteria bacterium]
NYGTGTVSGDGTQVVPDPDPANPGHLYGISHFDWHFPLPLPANAKNPCPDPRCPNRGDPVDPSTGLFVLTKTDIAFGGVRGQLAIVRTYRTLTGNPGPFGIGTNHNYGYMLDTTNVRGGSSDLVRKGSIDLVMPDGNHFPFSRQADGTFLNTTIPSVRGAVISNLTCISTIFGYGCGGTLKWKNGMIQQFQPVLGGQPWAAFLMSITDSNGNETTLARDPSFPNQITQVIDPVGRALSLTYDDSSRITSITDAIGRTVQYTYNSQGTLATVTDEAGGVTSYTYDSQNRLVSITDARNVTYLENTYDESGRVMKQDTADGGVMSFSYTPLNSQVSTTVTVSAAASAAS